MASTADLAIVLKCVDQATPALKSVHAALAGLGNVAAAPAKAIGTMTDALGKLGLAGLGIQTLAAGARGLGDALGLGLANEMEQTRASLMAFTKDAGAANDILEMVRVEAAKTPFSFQEMASAAAGLLPVSKASGAGLQDLMKTAEILSASNPMQGFEGAVFSLREAVTGDFTSIIERFNLSRSTINKLKAEGVPNLEIVRRAMLEMGFDSDLIATKAETLSGRWSTFQDTLDTLKVRLSQPIFDALKEGLIGVQSFLDGNMDTFEGWADTAAGAIDATITSLKALFAAFTVDPGALGIVLDQIRELFGDGVADAVQPFLQGFMDAIPGIQAFAAGVMAAIGNLPSQVGGIFSAITGAVAPIVEQLAPLVQTAFETIGTAIEAVRPVFQDIVAAISDLITSGGDLGLLHDNLMEAFGIDITPLLGALQQVTDFVSANAVPILAGLAAIIISSVVPSTLAWATAQATQAAAAVAAGIATVTAMAPVILTLGAIGLAVGLLVAAWVNDWGGIQEKTAAVWAFLQPIFEGIFTELGRFASEMLPLVSSAWGTIQTVISVAMGIVWDFIQYQVGALVTFWEQNWRNAATVLSVVWEGIKITVDTIWTLIAGIIKTGLQLLSGDWEGAWNTIKDTMAHVLDNAVKYVTQIIPEFAGAALELGKSVLGGVLQGVGDLGTKLFEKIKSGLNWALGAVRNDQEVKSPSKLWARELGDPIGAGIQLGAVEKLKADLAPAVSGAITAAMQGLSASTVGANVGQSVATAMTAAIAKFGTKPPTGSNPAKSWAATMDLENGLFAELTRAEPHVGTITQAFQQMSIAVGPLLRQVASGAIDVDQLNEAQVRLAAGAGLTQEPLQDAIRNNNAWSEGIKEMASSLVGTLPIVGDWLQQLDAGAIGSNEFSLRMLQLIRSMSSFGKDAQPAVETAQKTADTLGVTADNFGDATQAAADAKPQLDANAASLADVQARGQEANKQVADYTAGLDKLDVQALSRQEDGWRSIADAIRKAVSRLGDYADAIRTLPSAPESSGLDVPHFATGGLVPGALGTPLLAVVHGGEYVVPAGGARPGGGAAAASVTNHITVNLPNYLGDKQEIVRMLREELVRVGKRNGGLWGQYA